MAEFKHGRLEVWQDARNLVKRIYATSARFPKAERFGLGTVAGPVRSHHLVET